MGGSADGRTEGSELLPRAGERRMKNEMLLVLKDARARTTSNGTDATKTTMATSFQAKVVHPRVDRGCGGYCFSEWTTR